MTTYVGKHLPRRGTAAQWSSANPVLGEGERGWETDTDQEKTGDGVTPWNDLPYNPGHGATLAAQGVSFTPTGTIAATNVQAAIAEVASEGGGGAVSSVNGKTGAVVLTAADVNADAAGSANSVQTNLDDHEELAGAGTHLPTGGTSGQVPVKGSDTTVEWASLDASDVGADPAGTATTAVSTHAAVEGAGAHLPEGGTEGQVPVAGADSTVGWALFAGAAVKVSDGEGGYTWPGGAEPDPGSYHAIIFAGPDDPVTAVTGGRDDPADLWVGG